MQFPNTKRNSHAMIFFTSKRCFAYSRMALVKPIKDMPNNEFVSQINTLKSFLRRGGRSILILTVGLGTLYYANSKRLESEKRDSKKHLSPSERYIQEMVDGGWPVDEEDAKKVSR